MKIQIRAAVSALAFISSQALADERLVPQQYQTIQAAIDASSHGDVVTVSPGFYEEVIRFGGRGISVRGSGGAGATVIARPLNAPSSPVVVFDAGETSAAVLSGFTISRGTGVFTDIFGCNCDGYQLGGGVFVSGASPVVRDCIVADNSCGTYFSRGGGIYVGSGSPVFERCIVRDNQANGGYGSGGGIHVAGGSPQFLDCTVRNCSVQSYHSGNCGGIAVAGGTPYFQNCRITGNSASGGVGGLCVNPSTVLERVYVGSANGATPISGTFADMGGNVVNGDCNGNGVPDHVDIADGTSADIDDDGMPDECICRHSWNCCTGGGRTTWQVPGHFPDLQSAIVGACAGDVIEVGAGTFRGPFAVQSKALTIRGQGTAATFLTGNGESHVLSVSGVAEPSLRLERLTVSGGRSADNGAGIRAVASLVQLVDCRVRDNVASRGIGCAWCGVDLYGGGIYAIGGSHVLLQDCVVEENQVRQSFNAWGAYGAARGGGIYAAGSMVRLLRTVVRDNVARADDYPPPANNNGATAHGAGVELRAGTVLDAVDSTFSANRIFGDTCRGGSGAGIGIRASTATVTRGVIRGNLCQATAGPSQGAGIAVEEGGQLVMDGSLMRINLAGGTDAAQPGSALFIASGSATIGNTEICGSGASPISGSWTDAGSVAVTPSCCPGDLDYDTEVNGADLGIFLNSWGPCGGACPADFDRNGIVDGSDLGEFLSHWGPCPG